jgi:hypothetical protein
MTKIRLLFLFIIISLIVFACTPSLPAGDIPDTAPTIGKNTTLATTELDITATPHQPIASPTIVEPTATQVPDPLQLFFDGEKSFAELTKDMSIDEKLDTSRKIADKLNQNLPDSVRVRAERSSGAVPPQNRILIEIQAGSITPQDINPESKSHAKYPPLNNIRYLFVEDTGKEIPANLENQFFPLIEVNGDYLIEYKGKKIKTPIIETYPEKISTLMNNALSSAGRSDINQWESYFNTSKGLEGFFPLSCIVLSNMTDNESIYNIDQFSIPAAHIECALIIKDKNGQAYLARSLAMPQYVFTEFIHQSPNGNWMDKSFKDLGDYNPKHPFASLETGSHLYFFGLNFSNRYFENGSSVLSIESSKDLEGVLNLSFLVSYQ